MHFSHTFISFSHPHTNTNSLQATVKAINKLHKIKQTKSNYENERGMHGKFLLKSFHAHALYQVNQITLSTF